MTTDIGPAQRPGTNPLVDKHIADVVAVIFVAVVVIYSASGPISQFIHATPAPTRTAPPRETSTPTRPLDAAA